MYSLLVPQLDDVPLQAFILHKAHRRPKVLLSWVFPTLVLIQKLWKCGGSITVIFKQPWSKQTGWMPSLGREYFWGKRQKNNIVVCALKRFHRKQVARYSIHVYIKDLKDHFLPHLVIHFAMSWTRMPKVTMDYLSYIITRAGYRF